MAKRGRKPKMLAVGSVYGLQRVVRCYFVDPSTMADCECVECKRTSTRRCADLRRVEGSSCVCQLDNRLKVDQVRFIFDGLNEGRTMKSLADELGVSKQAVQQYTRFMTRLVIYEWKEHEQFGLERNQE